MDYYHSYTFDATLLGLLELIYHLDYMQLTNNYLLKLPVYLVCFLFFSYLKMTRITNVVFSFLSVQSETKWST